ncbi:hypothetical protein FDECE_6621 [Fusarium decemcellulare]|nr:hypothetical protein FDECE_6621 [Fusarium decemcellulare]
MEDVITAEQQALREQEEALMRENEEAQRLEDEANLTKGMEDAARGAEKDVLLATNELSQLNHAARGQSKVLFAPCYPRVIYEEGASITVQTPLLPSAPPKRDALALQDRILITTLPIFTGTWIGTGTELFRSEQV